MYLKNHKNSRLGIILEVLVFVLVFFIPLNLHSEDTGFKYLKNYSYREYDHQAQNWGMVQTNNGIIYVANHGGVLEFDGVSWRLIDVPNLTVWSLTIDEEGTIYIGGKNEIGYLAADAKGTLIYKSLRDYLPDNQKDFSNVWGTYAIGKNIYFDTSTFLFRWDPGQGKLVGLPCRYQAFFICAGKLFIRGEKTGLAQITQMESDGLKIVPVPGGEEFVKKKIYMMIPFDKGKLIIGTYENGLYLHDGKTTRPFLTEMDDYLKKNKLYHGIRLSSGDFALATLHGGLAIINPDGRLKYIIDKSSGLQDDNIKYVFQDNRENLWLCLDRGISKIEYSSPISIHDERSNLNGIVLSVVKNHDDLYVGTTNGLYYLESPLKFCLITGISSSCWSLVSIEDSVLAATSEGVFQVKKKNQQKVVKDLAFVLLPSKKYPDLTWCGTKNGLKALMRENNSQWVEMHRLGTINQEIRTIVEDNDGNLWLFTSPEGVLKVDFPVNIDHPLVTRYDTSHGLPGGPVYGTVAAGHVMFATSEGMFRFDDKNKVFIPDQTLGDEFAGGSHSRPVFRIVEDKNKNIWFHSQSKNYQARPGPGNFYTIDSQPFRRIPTIQVNAIYPDPNGKTIWFASYEGLIRCDTAIKKNYQQDFPTLIRRVLVNEKLIFDGCKKKTGKDFNGLFPIIEYRDRNLHFEFASPFFEAETETMYRSFLEGYDGNWPPWSKDTKRNYTNLSSGLYTFRVQAKNVYQHLGSEDIFRFKVLPPWYKAWWAFLLYAMGMLMGIYGIVKWRFVKLEKEKQKLENIIKERTKEINEKNEQLEKQTFQLRVQSEKLKEKSDQLEKQTLQLRDQSEKLKEMDKVKSRFFANISHEFRTPLTLIMSPLEQMLSDSQDKEHKQVLKVMLRNSRRLLTLINQLLDLSRFDSGKMKLQAACQNIVLFLKDTLSSFRILALQNHLELGFHCEPGDIFIYFDTQKMEEVMYNLLINAIKFTPPGGKIMVSVSLDQQDPGQPEVKISVRDTGIGIPKDQFDYIFDRFYQAKGLKEEAYKGTGIGLALTKEIILLHHGNIDVHSKEGEGTEFVVRLPMGNRHFKPGEIAASSAIPSDRKKAEEIETLYMSPEEEYGGEENKDVEIKDSKGETQPGKQEKNVILVVEDHVDVRKHIRDSLKSLYKIEEAGNGREGIEKAKKIIPDLIISDIMMPEVDGCELCRVLKKELKTSHIPIILLTAKASETSIINGLETGADDYITKPFNKRILITRIKNLIDLRRQLQRKFQREMMLQPPEIKVSSMDEKFIKEIQDIIEKNISDSRFHVKQLSKKLYMDRVSIYRKMKALTGETPTEYIRSYRLKRAAQLLKDNFGNVSEVAVEVGFSNLGYFTRCFKEKFQQLPSDYQATESQ
jgi:signal transduction histidine kinase/DNA-binding response OmpR family regulator/ligand-binding sensor domain-containing protein